MGTRSLTHVKQDGETILTMYRQYDGYLAGHGADLAEFLSDFKIVNGFGERVPKLANGMGCLAAQIVANFKKGVGDFYLYKPGTSDVGEEYVYTVEGSEGKPLQITCHSVYKKELVFAGTPEELTKQVARAEKRKKT